MSALRAGPPELFGRRVHLRPLAPNDWEQWREVRLRCRQWLEIWEPRPPAHYPNPEIDRRAFVARCGARERERELGAGFGFGVFVGDRFVGEINVNSIQRGPFQNTYVGYWMDESQAGQGYIPEAVVCVLRFAFEEAGLHRIQISIVPRNARSRRVVEKLDIREEGIAVRYLQINGVWEDHIRYAMTTEEWAERRDELIAAWID